MHGSLALVYGSPFSGVEEPLELLQAFAELVPGALASSAPRVAAALSTG